MVKDFSAYPWTSYHSIASEKPTKILRKEVIDWFGGIERFKQIHKDIGEYYNHFTGSIEEDDN